MPFQIDGRGDMNAFVLTSPLAGVMLLTRRQPFYPSAAHDKFFSICTAFGGYTKFGIAPHRCLPFSSANLFCYQSCSQLHLNGFLAFCKAFPRSVSGSSSLLRTIPDDLTNWYLREWGSYQPDISAIQEKCRHESSIIKETAAMKKWVKQWDSESKEGKHKVPYPIDWDELRTLLLECAIRRKIINQTQTKLQRQLFNRILNRLQISVQ